MAGLLTAGCGIGKLPDPNDPNQAGPLRFEALRRQLGAAAVAFNERKARGEINEAQYRELMAQVAREQIARFEPGEIPPNKAWMYGEALVTARMWPEAERVYEVAVANAATYKNDQFTALGRWVTDTLALARIKAELGKVGEAVALAEQTFGVLPKAKAPILPAVLYEIVPAAQGKGYDLQLGNLLVGAISEHSQVIVDPGTDAGRAFLMARPHHVRRGWVRAAKLYAAAGRPDLAAEALRRAQDPSSIEL